MGEAPMSSLTLWWNWPSWMMVTVLTVHQVSSDLTSVGRHWGAHFCQVEAQAPHVVSTGTAGGGNTGQATGDQSPSSLFDLSEPTPALYYSLVGVGI